MSDPWLVVTDSEGLVARAIIHKDSVVLECWPGGGDTTYRNVVAKGDAVVCPSLHALAFDHMENEQEGPAFFLVTGSCRDFVIGFRFVDDKGQKCRWDLCGGWIPDGKETFNVRVRYLKACARLDDALDQAIWHMIVRIIGAQDGRERSEE